MAPVVDRSRGQSSGMVWSSSSVITSIHFKSFCSISSCSTYHKVVSNSTGPWESEVLPVPISDRSQIWRDTLADWLQAASPAGTGQDGRGEFCDGQHPWGWGWFGAFPNAMYHTGDQPLLWSQDLGRFPRFLVYDTMVLSLHMILMLSASGRGLTLRAKKSWQTHRVRA